MADVIYVIEAIGQLGKFDKTKIKKLACEMLDDPCHMPTRDEFISLALMQGYKNNRIAEYLGIAKQNISNVKKKTKNVYYPYPRLSVADDEELIKFNDIMDKFTKAGI